MATVLALGLGGTAAVAAPVSAPSTSLSAEDHAFLEQQFKTLGVAEEVQDDLVESIARGDMPDADSGDVEPVQESERVLRDGTLEVRKTYPDGSVNLATEIPDVPVVDQGAITPFSVTGCGRRQSGNTTYMTGCFVRHAATTWTMSFYSNFHYGLNGHYISSISQPRTGGIGVGSGTLSYIQRSAGSSGTAIAEIRARQTQQIGGIGASRDIGMQLRVSLSGGRTTHWGS
ncbi:hypothetical protein LG293_17385 (plasmid) [Citricoccus nitrophenolicus]